MTYLQRGVINAAPKLVWVVVRLEASHALYPLRPACKRRDALKRRRHGVQSQ